jgi:hypothetical protein
VVEEVLGWASALQRRVERLGGEDAVVGHGDRPADDEPREQVDDDRQVEPALAGDQFGRVADPLLVGPLGREVAVEE